jgi:hypothetical protein
VLSYGMHHRSVVLGLLVHLHVIIYLLILVQHARISLANHFADNILVATQNHCRTSSDGN